MLKWGEPVSKDLLEVLYYERGLSAQEIADRLGISHHKVAYWMDQYGLQRRDASEASYLKHNPDKALMMSWMNDLLEGKV